MAFLLLHNYTDFIARGHLAKRPIFAETRNMGRCGPCLNQGSRLRSPACFARFEATRRGMGMGSDAHETAG